MMKILVKLNDVEISILTPHVSRIEITVSDEERSTNSGEEDKKDEIHTPEINTPKAEDTRNEDEGDMEDDDEPHYCTFECTCHLNTFKKE